MTWRRLGYVVIWLASSWLGCDRDTKPAPPATATPPTAAAAAPSAAPPARVSDSGELEVVLPPIVLPEWAKRPVEPDSNPRVFGEARSICSAIKNQRFSSFGQIGTTTRRWSRLMWLFSQGDQGAACEIERLVRRVADEPGSDCKRLVPFFERTCKSYPPREIR
jgi:hypothetical protein